MHKNITFDFSLQGHIFTRHTLVSTDNQSVIFRWVSGISKSSDWDGFLRSCTFIQTLITITSEMRKRIISLKNSLLSTDSSTLSWFPWGHGHRKMRAFLQREGISLSKTTVHKYMNRELQLYSICRRKRPAYHRGLAHKIFPNLSIKAEFFF